MLVCARVRACTRACVRACVRARFPVYLYTPWSRLIVYNSNSFVVGGDSIGNYKSIQHQY